MRCNVYKNKPTLARLIERSAEFFEMCMQVALRQFPVVCQVQGRDYIHTFTQLGMQLAGIPAAVLKLRNIVLLFVFIDANAQGSDFWKRRRMHATR